MPLLDYQIPHKDALVSAIRLQGAALDGSDMGTGKTWAAGGVIHELALPTLVMCPAICVPAWQRMGEALGVEFDVTNYEKVRTGRTPYGSWTNPPPEGVREKFLKCNSCQIKFAPGEAMTPCPHHGLGIHCVETLSTPHDYGKFLWNPAVGFIVFDEVHRCASLDHSLQAEMLIAAKRASKKILGLSATVADSPLSLRAIGYALNIHGLVDRKGGETPGFYKWAQSHQCRFFAGRGFTFTAKKAVRHMVMERIHDRIFPDCGSRVKISDLGDKFPDTQITAEYYDIEKSPRIDALYAEMEEALAVLHGIASGDRENALTLILRARQEIELLKAPIFVELTNDAIAEGKSVAIFVNFRQTIEELCKKLKTQCRVDGSQTGAAGMARRQKNVSDFLTDAERKIVVSSDAGGVGIDLDDKLGQFARLGLVSLGFSARATRQVFGRLRRQGSKSKSLYRCILAGQDEKKLHARLAPKLDHIDLLNDGDLHATNLPLTEFVPTTGTE